MSDLLENLRAHLVTQSIVRVPSVAAPGGDLNRPPMWLMPRNGTPAPGEGNDAVEVGPDSVLGAILSGGFPARPFESSLQEPTVDIWFRTLKAPRAVALWRLVRAALIDQRNFTMGTEVVIDCEEWKPFQPLESGDQGYTFIAGLRFQTYVV